MNRLVLTRAAAVSLVLAVPALAIPAAALPSVPTTPAVDSFTEQVAPVQLLRVHTPTPADKALLQTLGLDLTEHAGPDFVEVVTHGAADTDALRAAGLDWDVEVADLALQTREAQQATAAYAAAVERSPLPSGRTSYRTLDDYNDDMGRLAALRPSLVQEIALPHESLEGRTVQGVVISGNVAASASKPTLLMMGVHHAREWPSGESAMEFGFDLVKSYGEEQRITSLLNRARVVIVPVVNPDGFTASITDGMTIDLREVDNGGTVSILGTPGNAYKRKNCRVVDGTAPLPGACAAAKSPGGYGIGIDPNRNYGGFWGGPGASDNAADPTYRGAGPFSEPETQNVRELVSSMQVTTMITNHTFSNLVLRPPGLREQGNTPDEERYKALGAAMAAENGYTNQHGYDLYDTTGTTEDWSYYATGGLGFTFEIGEEFHPPYPVVVEQYLGAGALAGRGNREAYLVALENTADPSAHSVVAGRAPAGATLRLAKEFATPTYDGSSFTDRLESTITIPAAGWFSWHVNPSTRPLVQEKLTETLASEPRREETFTSSTPLSPTQSEDVRFTVTAADAEADLLKVDLDWPTPDDYDLEVYREQADGTLTQVASSGNFVGEKETAYVQAPTAGVYVLRVINFASVSPTWTLTAGLYEATTTSDGQALIENWTLTCERPDGRVLQRIPVVVDRGQQVRVNLGVCRSRY